MNCESFRDIAGELATYRLMDATTRDDARAHAVICNSCANELNRAQTATQLLDLALSVEIEQAPLQVKQAVLAAFKKQSDLVPAKVTSPGNRFGWWIPAAAAILVFAVILFSRTSSTAPTSQGSDNKQTPAASYSPLPAAPPNDSPAAKTALVANPRHTDKTANRRLGNLSARKEARQSSNRGINLAKTATSTYVPLTYLSSSTAMESGTVVRVELSRASLLSLGVPVNIDGSTEHFKAELVIGDDGVIRALRLVE